MLLRPMYPPPQGLPENVTSLITMGTTVMVPFPDHQAWELTKDQGGAVPEQGSAHRLSGVHWCLSSQAAPRAPGEGLCLEHIPVLGWQDPCSRSRARQGLRKHTVNQLEECVSLQMEGPQPAPSHPQAPARREPLKDSGRFLPSARQPGVVTGTPGGERCDPFLPLPGQGRSRCRPCAAITTTPATSSAGGRPPRRPSGSST